MKMAATILAACALYPPTLPAMAEPIRFLFMFRFTRALTVVFSVFLTTLAGMMASQTTDLPRPSILKTAKKQELNYLLSEMFIQ